MSFKHKIKIANKRIGPGEPVFIIAEAGVNHNGDIQIAKGLVDAAKKAGADAVKFQTFKTENLSTKAAPKSTYHIETTGAKGSWFDLLKTHELDRHMHEVLIQYCQDKEIIFLSTPYDEESADLLEELDVPAFKVASTDTNNIPFLKYLASKKKPVLLSTGMCTLQEVRESVSALKEEGCDELILFHTTSNYPTEIENVNLLAMQKLSKEFSLPVGYSDHTTTKVTASVAVALGAVAYEKHLTLDKNLPGPDHRASSDPQEFKDVVTVIREAQTMLGSGEKGPTLSEMENMKKLRKSIVAVRDLAAGEVLGPDTLGIKRPGYGLEPKWFSSLLGKKVKKTIHEDDFIRWEDVE